MRNGFFIFIIAISVAACSSGIKEKKAVEYSNSEFSAFKGKAMSIIPKYKSSADIALFFESTGAPFMPHLINDPATYEKYKASKLIAGANIGIYFADALYQRSYGLVKEATKSTNAAIELAKALKLNFIFEELTKANDHSKEMTVDSLILKMDESLMHEDYILSEQERMQIYISMLTGNFIEKQYILFSLIFEYPKASSDESKLILLNELLIVLGKSSEATQNLIQLIEAFLPEDGSGFLLSELKNYGNDHKTLNISENIYEMTPAMVFENDILKRMYVSVDSMRNFIINPTK